MDDPRVKKLNPLVLVLLLSSAFFVVFVVISGALFMSGSKRSGGTVPGAALFAQGGIGIVELTGIITDSKKMLRQLETFEDDSTIKAILLRIDSPGGAVAPSQEIYDAVKHSKKPVVVSMGQVAASGGFYIAVAAKRIYANAGTITGSIGVIMQFVNLEKLYEWAKVKRYVLKTGRFKDSGADYRDMAPEERASLQSMIDDVLGQFKQAVVEGRKLPLDVVTAVADGRIFSGAQAKKLKLVDELGGIDDAIRGAAEIAGIKGKPRLVRADKKRHSRLFDLLMDDGPDEEAQSSASSSWIGRLSEIFLGDRSIAGRAALPPSLHSLIPGMYWLWTGS